MWTGIDDRGNTLEYVLVAILVAICALFAVGRFGGALRSKVGMAGSHVENIDSSADSKGTTSGSTVARSGRAAGSVLAPEKMGELAETSTQAEGVEVFGFTLSIKMAISIAVLIVAVGVLMIIRISKSVAKEEAKQVEE